MIYFYLFNNQILFQIFFTFKKRCHNFWTCVVSLRCRAENSAIGIKQMDLTNKWRIFDCTLLSHFRMHFMDWYVLPRETYWPWCQFKVITCYLLEAVGMSNICEPLWVSLIMSHLGKLSVCIVLCNIQINNQRHAYRLLANNEISPKTK